MKKEEEEPNEEDQEQLGLRLGGDLLRDIIFCAEGYNMKKATFIRHVLTEHIASYKEKVLARKAKS